MGTLRGSVNVPDTRDGFEEFLDGGDIEHRADYFSEACSHKGHRFSLVDENNPEIRSGSEPPSKLLMFCSTNANALNHTSDRRSDNDHF
jgi:hypothetical protein